MLARNETVLVVEDDDAVRKLVVRILSDAGYRVRVIGKPFAPEELLRKVREVLGGG